jgi:hypothetical protein
MHWVDLVKYKVYCWTMTNMGVKLWFPYKHEFLCEQSNY